MVFDDLINLLIGEDSIGVERVVEVLIERGRVVGNLNFSTIGEPLVVAAIQDVDLRVAVCLEHEGSSSRVQPGSGGVVNNDSL